MTQAYVGVLRLLCSHQTGSDSNDHHWTRPLIYTCTLPSTSRHTKTRACRDGPKKSTKQAKVRCHRFFTSTQVGQGRLSPSACPPSENTDEATVGRGTPP